LGAAYGTAKAGVGVAQMGILHPNVVMKNIIPCIMSGILGIYGLIVSVILTTRSTSSFPAHLRLDVTKSAFSIFRILY